MASKTALNAKNLQTLGAARLAALLIEISTGDAAAQRRLRLALAGGEGAGEVARTVRKRLAALARAGAFIDWRRRRKLIEDLQAQRRAIVEHVAPDDPADAFDLLWRLIALAPGVLARTDDSAGAVGDVFREAIPELAEAAARARLDPEALATQVCGAVADDPSGVWDGLIAALAPTLGPGGLAALRAQMTALAAEAGRRATGREIENWAAHRRDRALRRALLQIADALGDADGYAALIPAPERRAPDGAAAIATRMTQAGRAAEALAALDAADGRSEEWEDARIAALDALDRRDEATAFLWACFARSLSPRSLRAHLKRLPDFEDIDAEERGLSLIAAQPDLHAAIDALLDWPAPHRAAAAICARAAALDGDRYACLTPAAEALAPRWPLAATLALRAMIDFTLDHARTTRYGHAARHLAECARLAASVADFGPHETHAAFERRLRAEHGRRAAFWDRAPG